jgi:hypothetical protein
MYLLPKIERDEIVNKITENINKDIGPTSL